MQLPCRQRSALSAVPMERPENGILSLFGSIAGGLPGVKTDASQ